MGSIFRNPFIIHHRRVGVQTRDYAVSLALTDVEKELIDILGVERHEFVGERHYLLTGLVLSIFSELVRIDGREEVVLACKMTFLNLEQYFSTRPGVDAEHGMWMMLQAINNYYIQAPEKLADRFLLAISHERFKEISSSEIPGLVDLFKLYIANSINFLKKKIEDLR